MKRLVVACILIILLLSMLAFPPSQHGSSVFYISLAFAVCGLLLASWKCGVKKGLEYLWLAPKAKDLPALGPQAFALFLACVAAALCITGIFYAFGWLDTQNVYEKMVALPLPVLLVAFTLAPLGEEMLFRGLLFRRIAEWLGRLLGGGKLAAWLGWAAGAFVSSAIFALMHASYGSVAEVAVAFVLGLVLCAGTLRFGSLLPAVMAHAAFNFVSVVTAVLL